MKHVESPVGENSAPSLARCYWSDGVGSALAPAPDIAKLRPDIVVIGGGFAGLSAACRMAEARSGATIALVEANSIGYGASGRNGGLVSPLAAPIWLAGALRNRRQSDALRLLYQRSHAAAEWAKANAPDAEVQHVDLHIAAQGALTAAGLSEAADVVAQSGIPIAFDGGHSRSKDLRLRAYTVQPYKLALGLADYARRLGVCIYENAAVRSIDLAPRGARVTLSYGATLAAERVVVATNAYSQSIAMGATAPGKVVRNFMLATAPLSQKQLAALQRDRFVVELNRKYIFYRMHSGRLVFGGIDKAGQSASPDDFEIPNGIELALRRELGARLAGAGMPEIDFAWGGRFSMTATDLPVIAPCPANPAVLYNLGYGGTGVALTLALASVAAAMALDRKIDDEDADFVHQVMCETQLPILAGLQLAGRVSRRLLGRALSFNSAGDPAGGS